jgi:hypothetical protein
VVLHDVDHFVHSDAYGGVSKALYGILPVQYALIGAVLALVWRQDLRAPAAAAALAAGSIAAFVFAHVVPFGPQPVTEHDAPLITWLLIVVPVAVSAYVFAVGLRLRTAIYPGTR